MSDAVVFGFSSVYIQTMSAAALIELRAALERRFPDAVPLGRGTTAAVATGISALDGMLPGGGLARGRVTVWQPGGGATAVLRSALLAAAERGERVAWVDTASSLSADFWRRGPLLLRPASEREALVCAEELLRSGGFGLVVLAGAGRETARETVRLSRAVRVGGSAFVLVGADSTVSHLRVRSTIAPEGYRWRRNPFGEPVEAVAVRIEVEAAALGWGGRAAFELPVLTYGTRCSPDPRLVDRRGAQRGREAEPPRGWRSRRRGAVA